MARKNPFPKREREICRRVRQLREELKISRVKFGKVSGVDSQLLTNYEHGKAQLNYEAARRIVRAFNVNPRWLALGEEPKTGGGAFLPSPEVLQVGKRALFSLVFNRFLAKEGLEIEPDDDDKRLELEWYFKKLVERWINTIHTERLRWLEAYLKHIEYLIATEPPYEDQENAKHREERLDKRRPFLDEIVRLIGAHYARLAAEDREAAEKVKTKHYQSKDTDNLDNRPAAATVSDMGSVPTWPQLRKLIVEQTAARGAKAALADKLKVKRNALYNWLASRKQGAPNAELTLKLLDMFWKPATKQPKMKP